MDRSFLLQKEVVEASRDFVCIRLATYEEEREVAYLTKVFTGRMGTLENTVFTMLSPDARKYLVQPGRGPQQSFYDSSDMAKQMRTFASRYDSTDAPKSLPSMKDLRLSMNVAAADNVPLVVAVSDDDGERAKLNDKLAAVAWSKAIVGRTHYALPTTSIAMEVAKLPAKPGVYLVEPDAFGRTGKVLARFETADTVETLRSGIAEALTRFRPPAKDARAHIDTGVRSGVYWKTATPVTDPNGPRRPEPGRGSTP
jgi:hypothetical protein